MSSTFVHISIEISIINNTKYSLLEKTSVKLGPILKTLRHKMAYEEGEVPSAAKEQQGKDHEHKMDMKNILGYLN